MLVDMGRALYEGLVALIILIAGIAFGLGVLACWLLPKLWHWLIPIIHQATA